MKQNRVIMAKTEEAIGKIILYYFDLNSDSKCNTTAILRSDSLDNLWSIW